MYWDDGMHNNGIGPWWWLAMILLMILLFGGLAWLIVTVVRHSPARHDTGPPSSQPAPATTPSAEDILHERLARGDIDVDEYHQRIDALRTKRIE